jgi:hypothetical protein
MYCLACARSFRSSNGNGFGRFVDAGTQSKISSIISEEKFYGKRILFTET